MSTLMVLGPVVFDLVSNLQSINHEDTPAWAKHDVIGGGPVYEAMGMDEETVNLEGVIYPEHFGGVGTLSALKVANKRQIPLPLMRGNFRPIGFVILDGLSIDEAELNFGGLGREIYFSVSLKKTETVAGSLASQILSLF